MSITSAILKPAVALATARALFRGSQLPGFGSIDLISCYLISKVAYTGLNRLQEPQDFPKPDMPAYVIGIITVKLGKDAAAALGFRVSRLIWSEALLYLGVCLMIGAAVSNIPDIYQKMADIKKLERLYEKFDSDAKQYQADIAQNETALRIHKTLLNPPRKAALEQAILDYQNAIADPSTLQETLCALESSLGEFDNEIRPILEKNNYDSKCEGTLISQKDKSLIDIIKEGARLQSQLAKTRIELNNILGQLRKISPLGAMFEP